MDQIIDFSKGNGLIPAILQDYRTRQVLMLGYMNQEAYNKTVEEGVVWFYSRSKDRLWMKGETSGHIQKVKGLALDCDQDTLLLYVDPHGPTCHLGSQSCFGDDYFNLEILERTVADKVAHPQEGSYTKYLIEEGLDKILKKCGEEATEVLIAAKNQDRQELINELADLSYHLLVMMNQAGLTIGDVEEVLAERHGHQQSYSVRSEIEEW